jgi:hypothetical protein
MEIRDKFSTAEVEPIPQGLRCQVTHRAEWLLRKITQGSSHLMELNRLHRINNTHKLCFHQLLLQDRVATHCLDLSIYQEEHIKSLPQTEK